MILVRLTGGLGNQMFHYAVAKGCKRYKAESLILDHRLLCDLENDIDRIIQRPYALGVFRNIKAKLINHSLSQTLNKSGYLSSLRYKLFQRLTIRVEQDVMKPIEIKNITSRNIHLIGNFQSEKYFTSIREGLLDDFKFPELDARNKTTAKKIISSKNSISLHIRRGDYHSTSNKVIFTSVNLEYYFKSLEQIKDAIGEKSLHVFVFSDDPLWVKTALKSSDLVLHFVEGNSGENSWKDMYLMTLCRHHIIANSSFSWWGCWLSQSNGLKFAPRYWFLPNTYDYDITDIIPETWNIVDYPLTLSLESVV